LKSSPENVSGAGFQPVRPDPPAGSEGEGTGYKSVALVILAAVTAAYLAAVALTPSWLIGTPEYHWPVLHHGLWAMLPAAAFVLALAAGASLFLVSGLERILQARHGRARAYAALMLVGIAFQLAPFTAHRMGLLELPLRVYLSDHTSYFTDAAKIVDVDSWLLSYPRSIRGFATYTRTHPPGAVLLFFDAQRLMERLPGVADLIVNAVPGSGEAMKAFGLTPPQTAAGALCALILLLTAAAAVPLTFAIGRQIVTDERAAWAAVLFAAAPAFSHKTPVLDHLLAFLVLLAAWLTIIAIRKKNIWNILSAGLVIGAGLWFGTSLIAALPLCALLGGAAVLEFKQNRTPLSRLAALMAAVVVLLAGAAAAAVLLLGGVMDVSWLEAYRAITEVGWSFNNAASGRVRAWMWIAFDPYEIAAFAGLPLFGLFLLTLYRGAAPVFYRDLRSLDPWLIATIVFLLALDLSGKVCYEASRLAWFCFPLIAIIASRCAPLPGPGKKLIAPAVILTLQIVSTLVFLMIF